MGKNFSHRVIQICQNEVFISSPLSGKNTITFCNILDTLPGKRAGSQVKGVESIFYKYYFTHMIPGQLPVKKIWFKYFPVLQL